MNRREQLKVFFVTFAAVFAGSFGLYKALEYAYSPIGTSLAKTLQFEFSSVSLAGPGKYEYKPNSSPRLVMTMELKYPKSPVYNGPSIFPFHAQDRVMIVGLDK